MGRRQALFYPQLGGENRKQDAGSHGEDAQHFVLLVSQLSPPPTTTPQYLVSPWLMSVTCSGHVMRPTGLILFIIKRIPLNKVIKLTLSLTQLEFRGSGDS